MKKIIVLLVLTIFALYSCKNTQIEEDKLWEEVMDIHDEVMPKTSTINKIYGQLESFGKGNENLPSSDLERISVTMMELQKAEDGMMSWMNNIKQLEDLRADQSHEEIMQYLAGEKQKIEGVKEAMLGSVEKGEKLMKSLGINN